MTAVLTSIMGRLSRHPRNIDDDDFDVEAEAAASYHETMGNNLPAEVRRARARSHRAATPAHRFDRTG